jgi:hypothetical protein
METAARRLADTSKPRRGSDAGRFFARLSFAPSSEAGQLVF